MNIYVVLFPGFETLDVFGPIEVFGKLENAYIHYCSLSGGLVKNNDGVSLYTESSDNVENDCDGILLIPGGPGTRKEIDNKELLDVLRHWAENSRYVLSVCTGSALLAKTGLLDGRKATSNKRSFEWVTMSSDKVLWQKQARWVVDGKFYTSSGVSAGIDMAFGFVSDVYGKETADQIAFRIEYNRQTDSSKDDFMVV